MSNQQTRFSGIRALAAKFGMSTSTPALSADGAGGAPADDEDEDAAEGGEGGDAPAGDTPPTTDKPKKPAGEGEGEEDDDGDDADAGAAGGEGGDGSAAPGGSGTDASYDRGFTAGSEATAGRWAATFLNESCRNNLELATDLLADTTMTPDQIGAYCTRNPGASAQENPGLKKLATTPQPRVAMETGEAGGGGVTDVDEAKQSRKAAVKQVNADVRGRAARSGMATRKAGGPGGKGKDTVAAGAEK